jgi:BirA family transcriptional regulator, biotin operon repressor / biotin---[acetyl-CoA-carboxylase] ligase
METLFIGKNIIFLPEIDSTNSYAINLLKNVKLPEGTVVHAAKQTQGKGQRGSVWKSEAASNLTASIILKPLFLNLKNQFYLYQITALACYDTMAELLNISQIDIKIKWPNDILINRRKIAGILIENNVLKNQFNWCVVGIGININQHLFDNKFKATSLKLLGGNDVSVESVLKSVCRHLEKYYLALKSNKLEWIKDAYLQHLFGLNNWLDFEIHKTIKTCMVKGISDDGLLLLEDKQGKLIKVDVKEVAWSY